MSARRTSSAAFFLTVLCAAAPFAAHGAQRTAAPTTAPSATPSSGTSQEPTKGDATETSPISDTTAPSADETFDLDIRERRITEGSYQASTAVAVGSDDSAVGVDVGVAVGASNIDVTLTNVRGHVRFHGDLEPILRRIQARRQP